MPHSHAALPTDICAVIVTHQPDAVFFDHIATIRALVGWVVVVDNGSDSYIKDRLIALSSNDSIILLHSKENNLALAQNMGISQARSLHAGYVMLLDDDSVPAPDMITQMLNAYNALSEDVGIGLVAPQMSDANSNRKTLYTISVGTFGFKRVAASSTPLIWNAFNIIASGSLIPMKILDKVGGMDESYVIDYIDKEFCLRLLKANYQTLVVSAAILHHTIGRCQDHTLLGQRITTTNHSPLRRYYIYRNRLRTCARYVVGCPAFVLHDFLAIGYDMLRISLYEKQKIKKFLYILAGIWDACLGKSGYKPRWLNQTM